MRHPEYQYLDPLERASRAATNGIDRTGVGIAGVVRRTRFDLSDGTAPIFTTKRVFWKTAVKEMLWFDRRHEVADVVA